MLKTYFRQAWLLMRQNRLFTAIYIIGTALAIATTTLFAVIYYVKIQPIYPEYQRHDTAYFGTVRLNSIGTGNMMYQSQAGPELRDRVAEFKSVRDMTAIVDTYYDENFVKSADGFTDIEVALKPTDHIFFKIYTFDFIEGSPFSQADFDSGVPTAVITDEFARQVFGTDRGLVGRNIRLNYRDYRICGVVRGGSAVNRHSYGQLYVPYTSCVIDEPGEETGLAGSFNLVVTTDDLDGLRRETDEFVRRFNSSQDKRELYLFGQPLHHPLSAFFSTQNSKPSWGKAVRGNLLILLALLLVPALNLSGMISGRMETRGAELGVRRSFGATRGNLLGQVIWENLLLTLLGGVLGLLICWLMLWASSGSLLTIIDDHFDHMAGPASLTADMLFSPAIFGITFILSLALNLLSAIIPAVATSRRQIVKSLKEK